MTLETEKDISCLKALAFSIVFFSLATFTLPYLAMGSPGQLPTLPNGFPFVEARLTSEEKNSSNRYREGSPVIRLAV